MTTGFRRPLVVGYGSAMRGDDAVGWYVADLLALERRFADVDVLAVHQLTPELAADFAAASRVVLVDAADDGDEPGTVHVTEVAPDHGDAGVFSHHVDAAALVALTDELYGDAPPTTMVTVSLDSVRHDERLSTPVASAIPDLLAIVTRLSLEAESA
ncbi:MAG TPA: hydrogenase maturation protease [Acidothermaceae bacterium]|jgi:hydrogenase maturation protease